jgi:hypothetical protein
VADRTDCAARFDARLRKYIETSDPDHVLNALQHARFDAMGEVRLEAMEAKKPVDTFVVDHVEKLPADNQARAKRVRMGPADGGRGRRIWPLCCTSMGRPCSAIGYGSGESIGQTRNNVIVTMSGYNGVSLRAMSNGRIGAQSTV